MSDQKPNPPRPEIPPQLVYDAEGRCLGRIVSRQEALAEMRKAWRAGLKRPDDLEQAVPGDSEPVQTAE